MDIFLSLNRFGNTFKISSKIFTTRIINRNSIGHITNILHNNTIVNRNLIGFLSNYFFKPEFNRFRSHQLLSTGIESVAYSSTCSYVFRFTPALNRLHNLSCISFIFVPNRHLRQSTHNYPIRIFSFLSKHAYGFISPSTIFLTTTHIVFL